MGSHKNIKEMGGLQTYPDEGLPIHWFIAFNIKYLQRLKFNKCVNHKRITADPGDACIDC